MIAKDNEIAPADTLSSRFDEKVAFSPDAIALIQAERQLTYMELAERANRLARYCLRLGVGTEDIIAVALPRNEAMVIALLAVAKTGAAYLPIDLDYPPRRISFMIEDARPKLILTDTANAERVSADGVAQVVVDDQVTETALAELSGASVGDVDRAAPIDPANTAYVIYTSGSTGAPKGVEVTHSGIGNLLSAQHLLGAVPGSKILQFASPSFDAFIWEICMSLLSGATLVLPSDVGDLLPDRINEIIDAKGITHITVPPSVLEMVPVGKAPDNLTLVTAGEQLTASLAGRWCSNARLFNAYGPTEATVCVTMTDIISSGIPSIGKPIPNTRVFVLDGQLLPVPPGMTGELYVAGEGLARGYLGQPSMTADRFLPCPAGPAGGRMYRTGDLVKLRQAGDLEFVGRVDDQVKIRGFRIELGEIEAAVASHPRVAHAVAAVREVVPGEKQVFAYFIPREGAAVDLEALRSHVVASLPTHMIPGAFIQVDSFPRTSSGKLDRAALPDPSGIRDGVGRSPQTGRDQQLCVLMAEVLEVPQVGLDDNFFELGGNSIRALRAVHRIRKELGFSISVRQLFEHPLIADLVSLMPR